MDAIQEGDSSETRTLHVKVAPQTVVLSRRIIARLGETAGFEAAISEFADRESAQFGQYAYRLIRTPQYKLIVWERPGRRDELYDLDRDPRETKNAIDDATLADVRENLRRRLEKWMRETDDSFRR